MRVMEGMKVEFRNKVQEELRLEFSMVRVKEVECREMVTGLRLEFSIVLEEMEVMLREELVIKLESGQNRERLEDQQLEPVRELKDCLLLKESLPLKPPLTTKPPILLDTLVVLQEAKSKLFP